MRVTITSEAESSPLQIPWESADPAKRYWDLREDPKALEKIDPARQHRPLYSFLAAVNASESIFATARCATRATAQPANGGEPYEFGSRVDLIFSREEFNLDRSNLEDVAQRLEQLLGHEPSDDTLRAELRLEPCRFNASRRSGYALAVFLHARGSTPEQAERRWALGLARVQQALLFTSRSLRRKEPELE